MPIISEGLLAEMLPRAATWAETISREILTRGVDLNPQGIELARRAGVQHPEQVRFFVVPAIPLPDEADLKEAALKFGLITQATAGLTLGYGILLVETAQGNGNIIAHELKHVAQYERYGGFAGFLQKYLSEVNEVGYPAAPMEQEAIAFAATEFPTT